jgi:hypothetical protein
MKQYVLMLNCCFSQYQHDGSEVLADQFKVRGIAGDKESVPAVVRVLVTPVNDEPPHIVNNTGLILWEGSTTVITPTHLGKSVCS